MAEQTAAKKGRKKGVSTVPANETDAERFKRVGKLRVSLALAKIDAVGKLTGKGYEFTQEQADKICSALQSSVDRVKTRYKEPAGGGNRPSFDL